MSMWSMAMSLMLWPKFGQVGEGPSDGELREDLSFELREDGTFELRDGP